MYSAAILAGGRASRFGGRDKSALIVEGRSIFDRQIAELSQVADDLLVIGGDVRDLPAGAPPGIRFVADQVPQCGPLGGLHAALAQARHSATFVVACDMPYISAPLAQHLLGLTADADIVVPQTERGYHPLCAAYTRACLEPVARRLVDKRLKLTALFDDVRVRVVTAEALRVFGDPERLLANVNTPDEYRLIEANKT